ncbi:MAG: hypothetical protein IKO19_01010 [Candidatus Riflebacteria bacterium]|nr:hypothetical protein [Candidatus Riflebacteria bacterium]
MNKIRYISIVILMLIAMPSLAHKEQKPFVDMLAAQEKELCIATSVTDSSKIISNPGNCPIEFLRRIGRAIAKNWPKDKTIIKTGALMFNELIGRPDCVRFINEDELSEKQIASLNNLVDGHSEKFNNIMSEFNSAPEAITFKMVINTAEIQRNLNELINKTSDKIPVIPDKEKEKIKENVLPIIESFSDAYSLFSISEKGVFGRFNAESEKGNLNQFLSTNNFTIQDIIDEEPMILLAQTHSVHEPDMVMKKLETIPNTKVIKQIIASAGLDFEKDLIANYATESILYVNLTPTGEKMLPDVRWIAKIPSGQKLIAILPKLQNLCMQAGVFVTAIDSIKDIGIVRLNHFILGEYGVFASVIGDYCVLTSTQEGAEKAINHLKEPSKKENFEFLKDYNLFFRLRTSDLNIQLQQFLQSPLLRNKGIPPITNLTFLNDMNDVIVKSSMTNKNVKISLDIPFIKKNNN